MAAITLSPTAQLPVSTADGDHLSLVVGLDLRPDVPLVDPVAQAFRLLGTPTGLAWSLLQFP